MTITLIIPLADDFDNGNTVPTEKRGEMMYSFLSHIVSSFEGHGWEVDYRNSNLHGDKSFENVEGDEDEAMELSNEAYASFWESYTF